MSGSCSLTDNLSSASFYPERTRLLAQPIMCGRLVDHTSTLKVNMVDATCLDEELLDLLRIQLGSMLSPPFWVAGLMERLKPEIDALLELTLCHFTILRNEPTPGMRMRGLRYCDGADMTSGAAPRQSQRLLLTSFWIGGRWLLARLRRHALIAGWSEEEEQAWPRRAQAWLERIEGMVRIAWLFNFLIFLKYGAYPSVVQRLSGMRLLHSKALGNMARKINFQFLNRQLLWEQFTQLALYIVPLVDWDALRRQVSGLIRQKRSPRTLMSDPSFLNDAGRDLSCAICEQDIAQTPYLTECGHVYCYYCLKTACLQDEHYACPRCGYLFANSMRLSCS